MGHIIVIVLNVLLSVIGAVFAIWLFWRALKNSSDPPKIIFKIALTLGIVIGEILFLHKLTYGMGGGMGPDFGSATLMAGSIALAGIILSVIWTPHLSDMLIAPITDLFDGGKLAPEPKPYYSVVHAKRKRGEYSHAVALVREQLAKFPNDYEGVNLLAAIQAEDMKDLRAAEITLNQFCEWEKAPPLQVAAALTQLADWHLKFAQDTTSARAALERIIAKYPDTELSTAAAQRIAHLGGVEKILLAAHDRRPVAVPEAMENAGLRDSIRHLVPEDVDPGKLATDLVKHLEQHPLDIEAREKLAVLYAEHYQRLDLATGELAQLIQQRGQSPKFVAHWLNLLADLQIRAGADYETVRPTLEKIIERYPGLPAGELARSRLNHLRLEIKGKQEKPPDKALGEYEQNIGLKYGPAYGSPRKL